MSHKEVWNMIINSRMEWPYGHPLHNLDVIVLYAFLFVCVIAFAAIVQMERTFCRESKESVTEYRRWLREWRNSHKE